MIKVNFSWQTMALYQVILLVLNYGMVAIVAGQAEVDKDVEVISGKPEDHPLDAKIIGNYPNDIYAPPVSFK